MNDSASFFNSTINYSIGIFWHAKGNGQPQQLTWEDVTINYSCGPFRYY